MNVIIVNALYYMYILSDNSLRASLMYLSLFYLNSLSVLITKSENNDFSYIQQSLDNILT